MTLTELQDKYLETKDNIYLEQFYKTALPFACLVSSKVCRGCSRYYNFKDVAHIVLSNIVVRFITDDDFYIHSSIEAYVSKAIQYYILDRTKKKTGVDLEQAENKVFVYDDNAIVERVIKRDIQSKVWETINKNTSRNDYRQIIYDNILYCLSKGVDIGYRRYRFRGPDNREIRQAYNITVKELKPVLKLYD